MTPPFLESIAGGNQKRQREFEAEVVPHLASIRNFALQRTGNRDDADDLMQDTVLRAYRFWDKYEKGTNVLAWLSRIMRNSHINQYRKNVKEPPKVDYDEANEAHHSMSVSPRFQVDLRQELYGNLLSDEVTAALEALPDEFRTVVILCDLEGMSYEETAEFVDCPLGTVRSRLHRARKHLQGELHEYAVAQGVVD